MSETILSTTGKRLRYIRSISGLIRKDILNKTGLSTATLRSWEGDKVCIKYENIKLCTKIYNSLGIDVGEKWIKNGDGEIPTLSGDKLRIKTIEPEIFSILNKKSVDFIGYVNHQKTILFYNENFKEVFNIETISNSENIENCFKEEYRDIETYVYKALNNSESVFEYINKSSKIYKTSFIPSIYEEKVIGFYIFAKEYKVINNINNYIPHINASDHTYNHNLFIESMSFVNNYIENKNMKLNIEAIIIVAKNIYLYSVKYNKFQKSYFDKIMRILDQLSLSIH